MRSCQRMRRKSPQNNPAQSMPTNCCPTYVGNRSLFAPCAKSRAHAWVFQSKDDWQQRCGANIGNIFQKGGEKKKKKKPSFVRSMLVSESTRPSLSIWSAMRSTRYLKKNDASSCSCKKNGVCVCICVHVYERACARARACVCVCVCVYKARAEETAPSPWN